MQDQESSDTLTQDSVAKTADELPDLRPCKRVDVPWKDYNFNMEQDDHKPIPWDMKKWWPNPQTGRIYALQLKVERHPKTGQKTIGQVVNVLPYGCPAFGLDEYMKIVKLCNKTDCTVMDAVLKILKKKLTEEFRELAAKSPLVRFNPGQPEKPDRYMSE